MIKKIIITAAAVGMVGFLVSNYLQVQNHADSNSSHHSANKTKVAATGSPVTYGSGYTATGPNAATNSHLVVSTYITSINKTLVATINRAIASGTYTVSFYERDGGTGTGSNNNLRLLQTRALGITTSSGLGEFQFASGGSASNGEALLVSGGLSTRRLVVFNIQYNQGNASFSISQFDPVDFVANPNTLNTRTSIAGFFDVSGNFFLYDLQENLTLPLPGDIFLNA